MNRNVFSWMNQFTQSPNGMLWESEADGGAATPTPAAAPAPAAATGSQSPAAPAPQAATPPAAQAPATGAPEGWVPSYRIRETREAAVREARADFDREMAGIRAEAERYKSQLHSLVGVTPPKDPEVQGVRDQFGKLYPGLQSLEEKAEQLQALIERAGDLETQNQHYWQSYGRQTMDRLFEHASKSLGAPLTDEGKRSLHSSFVGFVQSSPELQSRYSTDPSLVEEFWQAFTSSFIDPARRVAAANVSGRAGGTAIPQDRGGAIAPVTPGPKPANLDERAAQAWAKYQQDART